MDHQLLTVLSSLTGLHQATGSARPEPAALRDHQDLWCIAYAAFALLKAAPQTRLITSASLLPYLTPSVRGDKRSKPFQAAAAAQLERIGTILARTKGEIYVTIGRDGPAFSLSRPAQ